MQILDQAINMLEASANLVPLPIFIILGSFIEEIIAPIPSPLVMTLAGSLAATQGAGWAVLLGLAVIGAASKTIGSWIIHVLADKFEDVIVNKLGKYLGVSHKDTEGFGKYLNKGRTDDIVLFLLRAIPIVPTAPVSIVCGLLKINKRTYLVSTFFGTVVRNIFYVYLGFTSLGALESVNQGLDSWETIGYLIVFVILALLAVWMYRKRAAGGGLSFFERFNK